MKVLVIGNSPSIEEFKQKFDAGHSYIFYQDYSFDIEELATTDVVFDYNLEETPEAIEQYLEYPDLFLFINSPKVSLAQISHVFGRGYCKVAGFNGLASFVNRKKIEVSLLNEDDEESLAYICSSLGTEYLLVKDRVGMVLPRIMATIVNEAYYMLQEGTATEDDIDTAMKLSNRFPLGPFEWSRKVGVNQLYELLEALYEDTHDERYKVCSLLKREYLLKY